MFKAIQLLKKYLNAAMNMLHSLFSAPKKMWNARTWKPMTIVVLVDNWITGTRQYIISRWSSSTRHLFESMARAASYLFNSTFVMPRLSLMTGLSPGGSGGMFFWRDGSHAPHHSATDTQTHYRKVMAAQSATDPGCCNDDCSCGGGGGQANLVSPNLPTTTDRQ